MKNVHQTLNHLIHLNIFEYSHLNFPEKETLFIKYFLANILLPSLTYTYKSHRGEYTIRGTTNG